MGAVYSVYFKYKVRGQKKAYDAVKAFMDKGKVGRTKVHYNLEGFAKEGVNVNTLQGLLKVVFAGWKCNQFKRTSKDGWNKIENDFTARYSWEWVMVEVLKVLAPYLADGSILKITSDDLTEEDDYTETFVIDKGHEWKLI